MNILALPLQNNCIYAVGSLAFKEPRGIPSHRPAHIFNILQTSRHFSFCDLRQQGTSLGESASRKALLTPATETALTTTHAF
jgi:hypothetical protein